MQIISWNVNGMRSVHKKGFMPWFEETQPDILCLQETRAQKEQLEAHVYSPKGYHAYWNVAEKKGYSGVAVFSKKDPIAVNRSMGVSEFDAEGRFIQLEFEDFVLFNVYFPNGTQSEERLEYKLRFYDHFLNISNKFVAQGKHVITCGDFNTCHKEIDIARPKENSTRSGFLPIERAWMDKYVENGYCDIFRQFHPNGADQYTWWSNRGGARQRNVGWRIDYFFVNESMKDKIKKAFIWQEVMGSDHCPIGIKIV